MVMYMLQMVFRKYKPVKQWGKMDTKIFKAIFNARNQRQLPLFEIPSAVRSLNVAVHDPSGSDLFSSGIVKNERITTENRSRLFETGPIEEHELYNLVRCFVFDGLEPLSDGVDQACAISNSIVFHGFPEAIIHSHQHLDISEESVRDAISHGERYDPTMERLPRRFDPILFWLKHPRVHGTPVKKKNDTILQNLYRRITLAGIYSGRILDHPRCDNCEPISATIFGIPNSDDSPLVLRFQPHLCIQTENNAKPWASKIEVKAASQLSVPRVAPISPLIDLRVDHIYNKEAVIPRSRNHLSVNTIMWSREQDQKYPWTTEQNSANAILHTFGAAVSEATRNTSRNLDENPVIVKGVQLVDGKLDLVAVQLNTLDFSLKSIKKNIVWIEKSLPLYEAAPFYETIEDIKNMNMDSIHKLSALLLYR